MWDMLGLGKSDEAVYRYELSNPGSAPAQVAKGTGLAEAEVENSRERLIACQLLRRVHGEIRPSPAGPSAVAERLRADLEIKHARHRRQVSLFQAEMTQWLNAQLLGPVTARCQVERLRNPEAAIMLTEELLAGARAEVMRCAPVPFAEGRRTPVTGESRAAQRGVSVKLLYPSAQLTDPDLRRAVGDEIDAGMEVRVADGIGLNMTVVDRCCAVVTDQRRPGGHQHFLIRESGLAGTLYDLFELGWAYARDAAALLKSDDPDGEITAEERLLLQLLSIGWKDEAVAKRLGVSVRTVRRKISEIVLRLGASSRFQAGVMAARRAWT
ncbi:LuxR C-terminal-related transcriptional regulator [Actinoplanes sp. NPDC020271]|uniref:LuxR C-terminal-related transcriptional regulator n=1 Tax=Actinoplanes sp. NPDC020271 TaxID=3363896 RepID=UPI0037A523E1